VNLVELALGHGLELERVDELVDGGDAAGRLADQLGLSL